MRARGVHVLEDVAALREANDMPIITVNLLEGRDKNAKRALIREISDAAAHALNAPLSSVRVIINEMPFDNFGVAGETKADQIERMEGQQ